ncbi:MAG: Na/Pi cotransporter family protein [Synergistaceae bacterium]|nr:Na/Pi cotransporter family protein [Synergistaceae bacterium]
MSIQDVLNLLGGVALLIYGIKIMGDALQDLAGDNLRKLISSLTGTPVRGVAVGALVTVIIQSSSATTVMVVSFVHVGLMTLSQAFGVIMGANIGTTITAQFMAFSIQQYAIVAAVIGAFLTVAGKDRRQRQFGSGLVGFSLLFVGMDMMQNAMSFLRGRQDFFNLVNDNPVVGLLVGAGVTMLVQASSATVGLTMVMTTNGLLSLPAAIAIILGDNIGTTITAVLASLGGNRSAKQAAAAHVMFNVIGACIMMIFLTPFSAMVSRTSDEVARQVANSHSMFNIMNTLLFLPFVNQYTAFIRRIIPDDRKEADAARNTSYLNPKLISVAPAAGVDAVRKEMVRLGWIAYGMLKDCYRIIIEKENKIIPEVLMVEKTIDELTHSIISYSTEVGQTELSSDLSLILNSCASGAGDIERIGDHSENLVEAAQYMQEKKLKFSGKALAELSGMFNLALQAVEKAFKALESEDSNLSDEVLEIEPKIDQMERVLRARHIERLNSGKCEPATGVVFIDVLSNLERIGDHARNLAFIVKDVERVHTKQSAKQ